MPIGSHGEPEPLDWQEKEDVKDGPEHPYYKAGLGVGFAVYGFGEATGLLV